LLVIKWDEEGKRKKIEKEQIQPINYYIAQKYRFNVNWVDDNEMSNLHVHVSNKSIFIQPYETSCLEHLTELTRLRMDWVEKHCPVWSDLVDMLNNTRIFPFVSCWVYRQHRQPILVFLIHIQNLEKTKVFELKKSLMENYYTNIPDTDKEGNRALIFGYLAAKLVAYLLGHKNWLSIASYSYLFGNITEQYPVKFTNFGSCAALLFLNELDPTIEKHLILRNIPKEVRDTKKFKIYRQNQSQISTNEEASNETRRLGIYHHYLMVQNAIKQADYISFPTDKNYPIMNKLEAHWMFQQPEGINHLKIIFRRKKKREKVL